MRYWKNEAWIRMCEPDTTDEWLQHIWEIGFDYDGCNTVESLKELIDELVQASINARNCLAKERQDLSKT